MKNLLSLAIVLATLIAAIFFAPLSGQAGKSGLDPAPEGTFSVVVIPDTQKYLRQGAHAGSEGKGPLANPVFDSHTRWIIENLDRQRIVFVSHVGDVVDRNVPEQWKVARQCMDRLHGKVPYAMVAGNHDMAPNGDSSLFQKYFPASRFASFPWYGGTFSAGKAASAISGDNANSYQLFSAGGQDFVFLHLECNAPDNVLDCANAVLEKHSSRRAMASTHMYLGPIDYPKQPRSYVEAPKGRMRWTKRHGARGNSAEQMWKKCFSRHANLFVIFCGDQSRTTACYEKSVGKHGNTVHALLSDYMWAGPLRIYRFMPDQKRIRVITWDTALDRLCVGTDYAPERENHQFTIDE